MGKDEELGDIVMQKGCWDGGGKKGGEKKASKEQTKKRGGRKGMLEEGDRRVCKSGTGKAREDSVGQAGRTCVFVFD